MSELLTCQFNGSHLCAATCRSCGLFGIDFQFDGSVAWPTEVNPRYTASVEVFEKAYDLPFLDWHCRACCSFAQPHSAVHQKDSFSVLAEQIEQKRRQSGRVVGKAILFAPREIRFPTLDKAPKSLFLKDMRFLADRPAAETPISAGQPICTVLAAAETESGCRQLLASRAGWLSRELTISRLPVEKGK